MTDPTSEPRDLLQALSDSIRDARKDRKDRDAGPQPDTAPEGPVTDSELIYSSRDVEMLSEVAAERDALRGMVRRYHAGWYVVSASAPLRDVWCKDHYPDDGYVTEELTSAEADAFRRALDASPTEAPPTCDGIVPPTRHTAPMHCGRPPGHPGLHQYRPMDEDDASPTEGNPEANGVTTADMHVRITNHDLALKSRQRSSCAECDWTWPSPTEGNPE